VSAFSAPRSTHSHPLSIQRCNSAFSLWRPSGDDPEASCAGELVAGYLPVIHRPRCAACASYFVSLTSGCAPSGSLLSSLRTAAIKKTASRPTVHLLAGLAGTAHMRFQSVFPSPHAFRNDHPNPVPMIAAGAPLFTRAVAVFRASKLRGWLAKRALIRRTMHRHYYEAVVRM
jgi:hypothetical protein